MHLNARRRRSRRSVFRSDSPDNQSSPRDRRRERRPAGTGRRCRASRRSMCRTRLDRTSPGRQRRMSPRRIVACSKRCHDRPAPGHSRRHHSRLGDRDTRPHTVRRHSTPYTPHRTRCSRSPCTRDMCPLHKNRCHRSDRPARPGHKRPPPGSDRGRTLLSPHRRSGRLRSPGCTRTGRSRR
jgi:hypothetical protein